MRERHPPWSVVCVSVCVCGVCVCERERDRERERGTRIRASGPAEKHPPAGTVAVCVSE